MRLKTGLALAGAVAVAIPTKGRGQIVQYNFANGDATGVTLATMETPTSTATNAAAVNLSLGAKTDDATDDDGAASAFWASPSPDYLSVSRDSTAAATDDTNFYVQFTVTASPGYVLDPTGLTLVGGQGGGAAGQRSFYVTDSDDGIPSGSNDMTGTGSGPYDTNANGTIVGDWAFTVVRNSGATMDSPTIAFPGTDTNLASFTVRVFFDTITDSQNIDLASLTLNGSVVAGAPVSKWTSATSGDFNASANWNSGVPNGVGAEADFLSAITSNQVVYTDIPITLGKVVFNNTNASYALTGAVGTSLTLQTATGSALVDVQTGTHEINLPLILASNTIFQTDTATASLVIANPLTINSGASLTQTGAGAVTYSSTISVLNAGTIAFGSSSHAHALSLATGATASIGGSAVEFDSLSSSGTVNVQPSSKLIVNGAMTGAGKLNVASGGQVAFSPNLGNSTLNSLSITGSGTLDLNNNRLFVDYGTGPDPIKSIEQWIANGFANGESAGTGPSIISSAIATDDSTSGYSYGIGYADSADAGNPANLPTDTIEIMFTLLGDANLDGVVNAEDFTPFSHNLNQNGAWDQGDFNYDGVVNAEDFTSFSHNLNQSAVLASQAGALEAANGISLANVPEPASLGLLTIGAVSVLGRRRRREASFHPRVLSDVPKG